MTRPWSEDELQSLLRMWHEGRTRKEMAKLLGCSKDRVDLRLRQFQRNGDIPPVREAPTDPRDMSVKLPRLSFLERQFDWEMFV